MKKRKNEYLPETVTHPGFTLGEKLSEMGMGSKEFAVRTGKPEKTISQLLAGESAITPEMAVLFEDVTQIPAHFWMNRQQQYNEALARLKRKEALQEAIEWSKVFPYATMAKLGWVPQSRDAEEKVASLFRFFGLTSPKAFEDYYFAQKLKVSFRISLAHTKMPWAFAAWLRQGEITAQRIDALPYDARKFEENLIAIKILMATQPNNFFQKLQDICLKAGVKVVYTPCLPGATVHGSTRWLGDTPLIQMSARYKQNDIFWFTFFHEAAHILKHGKKFVTLEAVDCGNEDEEKEKEANAFAVQWTFSEDQEKEVLANKPFSEKSIIHYAEKFRTHPAIIVGRFHHKGMLPYTFGRKFIKSIEIDSQ